MAEKNPPVWMQSGTYNAVDDRLVTGMLSDRDRGADGTGSGILGGVVPGWGQLAVTAQGSTMQVFVASGSAVIPSVGTSPPGAYIVYNEGVKSLTLDIEASANKRIDVIYAMVEDQTVGGLVSAWRIAVKKGLPSASPSVPSLAAGQLPLGLVTVLPASQNGGVNKVTQSQIIDQRRMLTGLGGVHLTRNNLPNPPHAPGRILYNQDAKQTYISNGTTWDILYTYNQWLTYFAAFRPVHAMRSASVTVPTGAGSNKKWLPTPRLTGSANNAPVLQLTNVKSPSGRFKVSLSGYGKTDDKANGHAHLSIRVLQGTTTKREPGMAFDAVSFYSKNWEHHGTSFMVDGLEPNVAYTFRIEVYRGGPDANTVTVQRAYMMVEPIL